MNNLTFDVVFPVLDEENRIEFGITTFNTFLQENNLNNVNIIIADNGSTDGTTQKAKELSLQYTNVSYFSVSSIGVGLALKEGWSKSTADIIGYMDIDLSTDLKHFLEVLSFFNEDKGELIQASRNHKYSKVENRKLLRVITSHGLSNLVKYSLHIKITDAMCGFKFLKRDLYNKMKTEVGFRNDGWFFATEILILASRKFHVIINEIPAHWVDDPDASKSGSQIFKLIKYYLQEIRYFRKLLGSAY